MNTNITIDQVVDNGDNSLTITGHTDDGTSYTTSNGRKSELPTNQSDQMAYYEAMLISCLPSATPVLYQAPGYTPPNSDTDSDDSTS